MSTAERNAGLGIRIPTVHTAVVQDPKHFELPSEQNALIRWHIYVAFIAVGIAMVHGFAQALSYAGINLMGYFPGLKTYYQGLTVHGVLNALVFTFAFTNGFLSLTTARALGRPLNRWLLHGAFWSIILGIVFAGYGMFTNQASVLFTFYAPLQAHWTFYLGGALLVISTWLTAANLFVTMAAWRRENPAERYPLMAFAGVATYAMWVLASIGLAVQVVGFLLPWSLGLLDASDPLTMRTLFWYSGHPIVYFWLLPAYLSWYMMIPRQVQGRLISDPLTRMVFIMFLLFSIPTGYHHQYTDPGVPAFMKGLHGVMTFAIFFPSLATAFSVMAALEMGGRARGGKGLLGWIPKLPWGNPSVTAQLLAMLTFMVGGATGIINASLTMNKVIHNTTWVPGHFHTTVGTAVALTFMGIAYWLVPYLTKRELFGRRIAVAQAWVYSVGVLIFAKGMSAAGLEGQPRRTFMAEAPYFAESWRLPGYWTAVGGTLMTIGIVMFFVVLLGTILLGRKTDKPQDLPFAETLHPASKQGWEPILDRWKVWVLAAVILILIAYGPFLFYGMPPTLNAPGFKVF
jgi:cytochrome c oxidase subunit I